MTVGGFHTKVYTIKYIKKRKNIFVAICQIILIEKEKKKQ